MEQVKSEKFYCQQEELETLLTLQHLVFSPLFNPSYAWQVQDSNRDLTQY